MNHTVKDLVSAGAIFYVSHSGGKDSQAQYHVVRRQVPDSQIVVVHADLGEIEWTGVKEHIRANIEHELNVVRAVWKDGSEKDLFGMVRRRRATLDAQGKVDAPAWPSSAARFCTSDLKRDPIWKFIRRHSKEAGAKIVVNATGLRREESGARAKRIEKNGELCINKRQSNTVRDAWEWHPVANLTTAEVFQVIADAGQEAFWSYAAGNERLSCVFCIFGSKGDLANGAKHRPELARKYIELEKEVRSTLFHGDSLADRLPGEFKGIKIVA